MSIFKDWKLCTHNGCIDGSLVAVLYRAFGGEDIHFVSPGSDVDDTALELFHNFSGKILLADVSVSIETAKILDVRKHDVVLLDHHSTAIPLKDFSWCEIEEKNERCGSKMLFDWIRKQLFSRFDNGLLKVQAEKLEKYERLIEFGDDYDRWKKQFPKETEQLSLFHSCLGQQLFVDRFIQNPSPVLKTEELYLVSVNEYKKQQIIRQAKKDVQVLNKMIDGKERRVGFLSNRGYHSEVAEAIYDDLELNVDLVVLVGDRISFRAPARSDVDCAKLAAKWRGGGHKKSSGVSLRNVMMNTPLELVMETL